MLKIGLRIKELRLKVGLSQKKLSVAMGVSQGYLSQLESGSVDSPSIMICFSAVRALGLESVLDLIGEDSYGSSQLYPPLKEVLIKASLRRQKLVLGLLELFEEERTNDAGGDAASRDNGGRGKG